MKPKVVTLFNPKALFFKLILLFIIYTLYFILYTPSAFAQTPSTPATNNQLTAVNYIPPQSPNSATQAIYNFSHALSCILIGQSSMSPCLEYKLYKDTTGMIRSVPYLSSANTNNGVLGLSFSMIGEVIGTKSVSSSMFIADLGEQIGIKSARAQVGGSGSGVLSPIFKLWETSRNIAYLVMILVFIFVGLMIMFRQKLNPQTVVSIQLALPGLVIGLVMITFSYFLASLISDVAFVGTNIVGYYFSIAQNDPRPPTQLPLYNSRTNREDNVLSIFSRNTNIIGFGSLYSALSSVWNDLEDPRHLWEGGPVVDTQTALRGFAALIITQFFLPLGGGLFGGWGSFITATGTIGGGLIAPVTMVSSSFTFVIALILVYSMFRLLLKLINNFLSIIFLTIAAPFYFLAASVPGRQGIATNWMFNMFCNALAFPAVFAVFYFVAFILGNTTDPLFVVKEGVSLTNSATFPLLGGFDLKFLNALVAFGALIASPSIPDIICKAVGKPSQLGAVAAGAIGGAIAGGQRYQGQVSSLPGYASQNIGRLTDTRQYHITGFDKDTGKPKYEISPYQSHAGLVNRVGLELKDWWKRGSKEVPAAAPTTTTTTT